MRALILDSGIGGLGTAAALRRLMPKAELVYLADDAGFPYGERDDAALVAGLLAVMRRALRQVRPDLVVIACNTASTVALAALRQRFTVPFIGCVPPIKWAASITATRTIGLLATPATVRRPYLRGLVADYAFSCTVLAHGATHLAGLAEAKFHGREVDLDLLHAELHGLTGQPGAAGIDVIALGCTHYGRLLPELRARLPASVVWLDPAGPVARQACEVASRLPPGSDAGLDGVALFTGAVPMGEAARRWAAAGFSGLALCSA